MAIKYNYNNPIMQKYLKSKDAPSINVGKGDGRSVVKCNCGGVTGGPTTVRQIVVQQKSEPTEDTSKMSTTEKISTFLQVTAALGTSAASIIKAVADAKGSS